MTGPFHGADSRPVPHIDHVMVLLEPAAYQEAADSGFLRERFCRLTEKNADSSAAGQYATLGVVGENTLIEFFNAGLPAAAPLTGGLVFSFERPGSSLAARALLDAADHVQYHGDLVTRAVEGSTEKQPWYHLVSVQLGEGGKLLLFLNEVTPEYFAAVGASPAEDGALRRADYLDAVTGRRDANTLMMRDVTGVTLQVGAERARRITDALALFGYVVTESGESGEETCLQGPDLELRLRVDDRALERVVAIRLSLADGDCEPEEHRFGASSRLVVAKDATAQWFFD